MQSIQQSKDNGSYHNQSPTKKNVYYNSKIDYEISQHLQSQLKSGVNMAGLLTHNSIDRNQGRHLPTKSLHLNQNSGLVLDGKNAPPLGGMQTSESLGVHQQNVKDLMKEKIRTNYSIDFSATSKWKENNAGSHLKIKKHTAAGEDLSKFLNFYNKSTYMSVAKTMG